MSRDKRGAFTSNFGVMMAVVGSAVGLGNIWRFPYLAGANGGAAFLLLYLALIFMVGLPLILSEFMIGRATHRGAVDSFRILAPGKPWYLIGYLGVVAGFVILGFYNVVAGWSIHFLYDSIAGNFMGLSYDEISANFLAFKNTGYQPALIAVGFIALCGFVVHQGVEKGVERWNKFLMPMLFVMLLILCVNSFTLSGFDRGMEFLFKPDFSKITTGTVIDALGQVFFTLSLGMGVMITYSSYVMRKENMVRSKVGVTLIDTSIAIISGIAIFPAVFTYGISPTQGPDLIFLTLPNVFGQMIGGQFFAVVFFVLIVTAALTSSVSIYEMLTNYLIEEFRYTRKRAVIVLAVTFTIVSGLCSYSQVEGSSIVIFGYNLFDFLDMISSNVFMTVGGFLIALFAGWVMSKKLIFDTLTSKGHYNVRIFPIIYFVIRYIAPVAVAIIFLSKIGLIHG